MRQGQRSAVGGRDTQQRRKSGIIRYNKASKYET